MTLAMTKTNMLDLVYLLSAVCFIVGLKFLSKVNTAKQGNLISSLGMLIASVATFFFLEGGDVISLVWIAIAVLIGSAIGLVLAVKVEMTGMPQMVALFNGFGGIASLLVAIGTYSHNLVDMATANDPQAVAHLNAAQMAALKTWAASAPFSWDAMLATGLAVLIGGVTFTGSLVAFGKLQGLKITPAHPVQWPGGKAAIAGLTALGAVLSFLMIWYIDAWWMIWVVAAASLVLGVLLVIGIGGADMPVVISLLNSYSGLAAAMAGFVLNNVALIITGALVGASGIILTNIMCKAMNRSLINVLFGGVGAVSSGSSGSSGEKGNVHEFTVEDAAMVLDAAQSVIVVPGYGMAVAQAQHAVKELADELEKRQIDVKYAIHPVAGRMPGHMNVLLAEAGVPYEQLLDLEQINPEFERADVALVIGANDVTNPAARTEKDSPIYGMPILDVDKARTVFVIKRSLSPGFAGIDNGLYYLQNTGMIFGDAKKIATGLGQELAEI